ncbi:MAG TPA: hypothetical protein VM327_07890 [Candidatus Thermoplasmatota archaeon]|nr:hypothetical protein [Candidatus Thermoplasmatota archaeon]
MTRPIPFAPFACSILLTCLVLSGCSGSGDDGGASSTGPTSTGTGSPPPGLATGVDITRAPTSAEAATMATVCWEVFGTGTVAHVAIHWDNESHATQAGRTFADYDLGASYPGNQSSASSSGYQLSATGSRFCTAATMPASGAIFVIGHVIDSTGSPGRLSTEREIKVGQSSDAVIRIEHFAYSPNPLIVAPGATVLVTNVDQEAHTATGSAGSFDTGNIPGGGSKSFTAPTAPGQYAYTCAYHPGMSGVLQVNA